MKYWVHYFQEDGYHPCGSGWTLVIREGELKTIRGMIKRAERAFPNMGSPGRPAVAFQIFSSHGYEQERAITVKYFPKRLTQPI